MKIELIAVIIVVLIMILLEMPRFIAVNYSQLKLGVVHEEMK